MGSPPTRLGDFELGRELGRGGMGVVYEAVQTSLGRRVALKVLGPGLGLTPRAVDRFRREAAAAAKLHHTNIVPVYATSEQDGTHFYAMELIDGPSLDAVIRQLRSQSKAPNVAAPTDLATTDAYSPPDPLSIPSPSGATGGSSADRFDRIAAMVADVADALHHAHQNGVTHRDIKPSNLLLSPDGRLSVTDFGLARMLEQPGMTVTGEFVGTPAYMSPEQITAGRVPVDHRTDIYSLGATLYELLTLHPPFTADGRDKLLAMVIQKEPPPPRSIDPKVPSDLETICLKCLQKDTDRRYPSGKELADDLRRFVNRFAILARRAGPLTKVKKWVKRNPALSVVLGLALVAVATAGFFAYQSHLAGRLADEARQRHEDELREERRKAAMELAVVAAMSGDFAGADRALEEAVAHQASTADVRFLRGQLALYRGKSGEAIAHLAEAVRLAPDWPAAQAVLMRAYYDAGQMDEFYIRSNNLEQMLDADRLRTPADFLYVGQVKSVSNPQTALPLLDRAIELRDSVLTRLVRAEVRVKQAQDTGSTADAEAALEDSDRAVAALSDNPITLAIRMEARLVAASAYRRQGRPDDATVAIRLAGKDAAALKAHPHAPRAVQARVWYLDQADDEDAIRDEYQRNSGVPAGRAYFFLLYRRGRFADAVDVLDRMPRAGNEVMYHLRRAYAVANLAPDGIVRARTEYATALEATRGAPPRGRAAYADLIPVYLGRRQETADATRVRLRGGTFLEPWSHRQLQFRAGDISAKSLLDAAGPSLLRQCEAHFEIGLHALAEGDRTGARAHFERSVATGVFQFLEYEWSRAFLARLAADPTWPPWIAVAK